MCVEVGDGCWDVDVDVEDEDIPVTGFDHGLIYCIVHATDGNHFTYIYIILLCIAQLSPFPPSLPTSIADALPPSLKLPPHLSAHKYFLVCTLTVAAWDTLVLSPRTWRLMKSPGWPALKILFYFLRVFMPIEFTIVGALANYLNPQCGDLNTSLAVAFFDTKWSQAVSCSFNYYCRPNAFL